MASMRPNEVKRSYWSALYELWRLSWFEVPYDRITTPPLATCREMSDYARVSHSVPQPVYMWDWLKAIDHGDLLMKNADFRSKFSMSVVNYVTLRNRTATTSGSTTPNVDHESESTNRDFPPEIDKSVRTQCDEWFRRTHAQLENMRLSSEELSQVAGALIKTGLIGTRFRRNAVGQPSQYADGGIDKDTEGEEEEEEGADATGGEDGGSRNSSQDPHNSYITVQVYYVDPVAARNIQRFINNSPLMAFMDSIRPGHEGCCDQIYSLQTERNRGPVPQITQFNNILVRRHAAWAQSASEHTKGLTDACIESARSRYPL